MSAWMRLYFTVLHELKTCVCVNLALHPESNLSVLSTGRLLVLMHASVQNLQSNFITKLLLVSGRSDFEDVLVFVPFSRVAAQ